MADRYEAETVAYGDGSDRGEIIVVAKHEYGVRVTEDGVTSETGENLSSLNSLQKEGVRLSTMFGFNEAQVKYETRPLDGAIVDEVPDPSCFYQVEAPGIAMDRILECLCNEVAVEGIYWKPSTELPFVEAEWRDEDGFIEEMHELSSRLDASRPDYTSRQKYLEGEPHGIDAHYAWTRRGGYGEGVKIIDIEYAWLFTHEDLSVNQGGMIGGRNSDKRDHIVHGTSVLGIFWRRPKRLRSDGYLSRSLGVGVWGL
jgi:hypothetical protein